MEKRFRFAQNSRAAFLAAVICGAGFYPARVQAAGDATAGKALFADRCTACHSAQPTRKPAPLLAGVYGRRAGTEPNYAYSVALRDAHITWDARTLDRWLTDPPAFIPGVNMQARVANPKDRQNIIAYLKSISDGSAAPDNVNARHAPNSIR
jgi:cytochrome c